MNEKEARIIAKAQSQQNVEGIVVWLDWSNNEKVRINNYSEWLETATMADTKIAIYEGGEEL